MSRRIFVDMDGTLAEWKNVSKIDELYEEGYYYNLEPNKKLIENLKKMIQKGEEIYILSSFLNDSKYALVEKNRWLDSHFPELKNENRIFVKYGDDKSRYIKDGISDTDYLLDDYTKNLLEWKASGGVGIKYLNGINHTKGTWQGLMLDSNKLDNSLEKVINNYEANKDLFNKKTFITGSGQLHGETFALAFSKIYTFGPTFRTENSNTKTHANEFWMIEPEIAFADINDLMDIEEDFLKYIVKFVLENCPDEIDFFDKFVEKGLKEKLENVVNSTFIRIDHKEAIDLLKNSGEKWEFEPSYEEDIAKEHEKYITEYFNGPVFITNWPKDIKAFYMKQNEDGKTVAAVDLEVPGAGELMGGSQREENYEKLLNRMKELNMNTKEFEWYLNLRRYGTCIHSGFGMGFERLLIYLTGVENIRDVIPYPRTPGNCEF